ncbi:hypothetical protein HLH34_04260 [Gluconacetobacter azotocaptans]|uniref:Uncharacterized protein n=1 Tax=Gluconacetobacter azotocaptans TaxID=142834 RepID=A0A7W4PCE6_9PROT|nr:hypothetical protein [Gluconacetobacter azotocaptans]MBB2189177.1 hypothetical protein [Gluconacetobacter azotocaptans]GBQ32156.1 hypothetical protein AA13594_2286 [Gluconacetobacter azotocaptans DSM 13594]
MSADRTLQALETVTVPRAELGTNAALVRVIEVASSILSRSHRMSDIDGHDLLSACTVARTAITREIDAAAARQAEATRRDRAIPARRVRRRVSAGLAR